MPRFLLVAVGAVLVPVCIATSRPPGTVRVAAARAASPLPPAWQPSAAAPSAPVAPSPAPAPPPPCPAGMVEVHGFCVDRYEAHLVRCGPRGDCALHPYFERPRRGVVYEARSEPNQFPQAYVSRHDAQAACEKAGKRLCSRAEWQRACRGAQLTIYPYGDRWEAGRCNTDRPHLLTVLFGADPRRWRYDDFNDPALAREPGFLAKTGAHPGCVGDAGAHDLVGNLHEWVSDTVDGAWMARLEAESVARNFQPWRGGNGVFMGGFYSTRTEHGPGCTFTTVAHEPAYHDYSTGFRCCADAR